jgi:5-methylcytosine-specific restriction endonuclease McrA
MSEGWKGGSTTRWRKLRAAVLDRDGHLCQIRAAGCLDVATEVDHIQSLAFGGEKYDPGNLRAACQPCNLGRRTVVVDSRPTPHSRW